MRRTTILCVRRGGKVALGGDGQVTMGKVVVKSSAVKIRRLGQDKVLCGFAGATADSFALLERFEGKLEQYHGNVRRAAIELAKEWRTDRVLRRLEALLIVADQGVSLMLSGTGDVIEPDQGVLAIGSGGAYAQAAARALVENTELSARDIVHKSLQIVAELCVYTNDRIQIEEIP